MSVVINRHTVITNPRKKYRREYNIKLKLSPLIKYERTSYPRELGVIFTHPGSPFVQLDTGEWGRVYLQQILHRAQILFAVLTAAFLFLCEGSIIIFLVSRVNFLILPSATTTSCACLVSPFWIFEWFHC